jgi:hypothetical protein
MAMSRSLGVTILLALGAAAAVLGFAPGAWPNPLPEGELDSERSLLRLWAAATAVDSACRAGDLQQFAAVVTPNHRDTLRRQLAAVDQDLDAAALRALGRQRSHDYGMLLTQPLLAGQVRGQRAVVAVQHPAGAGAQLLAFAWDGQVLRLDESRPLPAVTSVSAAQAAVAEAVARRER